MEVNALNGIHNTSKGISDGKKKKSVRSKQKKQFCCSCIHRRRKGDNLLSEKEILEKYGNNFILLFVFLGSV